MLEISRPTIRHRMILLAVLFIANATATPAADSDSARPNVLFIAIDDLNDWIGCLNGHSQVRTPHMDRLAKRGLLFTHAHCAAPLCNPSRAAIFSGRHPFETGVFGNDDQDIRKAQPDLVLLPQHFKQAGYRTWGAGKLLHQKSTGLFDDDFFPEQRWSPFHPKQVEYTPAELPSKGMEHPRHLTELKGKSVKLPLNGMPSDRAARSPAGESFDWGPLEVEDADMGDGQIADWAVERLGRTTSQPFFLAVGFYRPHIPLFAPKKYFDLYAGLDMQLPPTKVDDLDDLSPTGRRWALEPITAGSHTTVVKHNQWGAAIQGYLACISFVDAQVGKLLDALDTGPHAGNTWVVLWSDHGWHLGEKQHWGKWTGWQRATHVPLLIVPPRETPAERYRRNAVCREPVSLLDLYPTLIDVCRLSPRTGLSGTSLTPLLSNPGQLTNRVVITTFDEGNHSLIGSRWHYIRYADGAEELYDLSEDPHEWTNVAEDESLGGVLANLRTQLPQRKAPK